MNGHQNVPSAGDGVDFAMPEGDHPLEIAARAGFGPLSPKVREVWHGRAAPCVTCGQLVTRDARSCDHCGQDLSPAMLEKMRAHAGPWYVLEHVRPFPGVSLARVVRQIRRGLIGETSIVRGPATDYQWRFAVETPGLCRYFNRCWKCHNSVSPGDTHCQNCRAYLLFEQPKEEFVSPPSASAIPTQAGRSASPHLRELTAVMDQAMIRRAIDDLPPPAEEEPAPRRSASGLWVIWVAAGMLLIAILVLWLVVSLKVGRPPTTASPPPSSPAAVDTAPESDVSVAP